MPKKSTPPSEADIAFALKALRALGTPADRLAPGCTVGRHKWPGRGFVSGAMGRCAVHVVSETRLARVGRELRALFETLTPTEL